jgi:hypothetical protein
MYLKKEEEETAKYSRRFVRALMYHLSYIFPGRLYVESSQEAAVSRSGYLLNFDMEIESVDLWYFQEGEKEMNPDYPAHEVAGENVTHLFTDDKVHNAPRTKTSFF